MRTQSVFVLIILFSNGIVCLAEELSNRTEPEASQAVVSQVERLLRQLDADTFSERQSAHLRLIKIGKPAMPMIRAAMSHESPEISGRARAIYSRIIGPGLVVYLPMDLNQLEYRRTRFPTCVKDRHGRADQAIQFPGKGYLLLRDHPKLDTDFQFTLSAWIHPTKVEYIRWKNPNQNEDKPTYPWGQYAASWAGHFIACKWDSQGSNGDYIFAITPSGQLAIGVSDREQAFVADSLCTKEEIPVNRWTHVATTFNRGKMKLFVNGSLVCEKRSQKVKRTNLFEYVHDDIYIGDFWNNAPGSESMYNFHGSIDEFCLFRKALTVEEIRHLMNVTD